MTRDPQKYATRLFEPPISAATRLHGVLLGVVWVDDSRVILLPRCAMRVTDDALAALGVWILYVYELGLAGVVGSSVVWLVSAESDSFGAGWPGVPSLRLEYFFGDGDLLGSGGVVGGVCVGLSTVGLPCSGVEL